MKITIKNQEYKLLHNIPQGTRLMYNGEECVKTEKNNMLVSINSGNVYMLQPTKKIYMDNKRKRMLLGLLSAGSFFIYNKQLCILIGSNCDLDSDLGSEVFNLNTHEFDFFCEDIEVELIQDKNIQIKVK